MNNVAKHNGYYPGLFEGLFGKEALGDFLSPNFNGNVPAVNVAETKDGFRIEVAAPGFQKSDIKLNLDGNQLTISAQKESKEQEGAEKYTRREFKFSSFRRSFTLPNSIDGSKIEAVYENGILLVTLPRKEEAKVKPSRDIEIA